ncbi:flagellar basal body-associated FliL family protein [Pararhodospirillum oryzae]|uniref:Flagellar protein FliL n=1 Tax=Pararhodospirillum oryzae TaxID=478448 RepID=A0A512H8L4_9PROT|nr:flagellar basal body-associated FliL family protein [Pararhodospirillum oryzae]GEO81796.1 flagellar basal body protein FliL [Pararhodospirillum oryzae]
MADDDLEEDLDEVETGKGAGGGKGGGKKKLILIILLPLLLVIGALAGAYFAGLMDPLLGGGDETASASASAEGGHDAPAGGDQGGGHGGGAGETSGATAGGPVFYDLDQIVVDLNSSGRRRSYLQMRLSLQLARREDVPIIEAMMPRIQDDFISFLRELRLEDLQGTAGMYRIQEELLIRVNNAAAPARVQDVLFKEMLIQ